MNILVTGATGLVGGQVVRELLERGARVRVLTRQAHAELPANVEIVKGDLLDPQTTEEALRGVEGLFLLNAAAPDELTQALIALEIARRLQVHHVTYLSIFEAHRFPDVSYFATKVAVEKALQEYGPAWTILRCGFFFQNDLKLRNALTQEGLYPSPLGTLGLCAVDVRDIAEAAALSLTSPGHVGKIYNLVGPGLINGPDNANLWSQLLGRDVRYTGHDFERWEADMRQHVPSWLAFAMRQMFEAMFIRSYISTESQADEISALLGHPPRAYKDWAAQTAEAWLCGLSVV
jgi:uncharacterized protein YbjT (DUF2867 family)